MFFVRSASVRDVAAVREVLVAGWRATYVSLYGPDKVEEMIAEWHSPEAIAANMGRPDGEYLVADDGKRIGGVAFATMSRAAGEGAAADTTVKLHQLYVHPDLTGQGIGRDLFAEIETCFPDASRLRLEVDPSNARAIGFYTAHGMAEAGRTSDCGGAGSNIPAVVMEKLLGV
ncbi:ribosomal protein S18 acetylase RimI-like enzyme [Hoeflea marina]|uniref:Ribosomal protein S18 acetylase RimI-like enzyme n=1 Tax=Hoeflea marina TaxID=274592 RepID=A0A317PPR6_9HYPH|nr:GNAT family N-acetyltransferase [Hoeflea marina]PWW03511.1 ribosomal protein S18 acetylase RimI-like enzyme [Hoeflea marina]